MVSHTMRRLHVPRTHDDDPEFIALVSDILNGAVVRYQPEDVYVTQIVNWFGVRWMRWPAGIGSEVRVRFFDSLIMPPFHPRRVKNHVHFHRISPDGADYAEQPAACCHLPYSDHLETRWRPIWRLADSGVFLWYSSMTATADRASLMLYRIARDRPVRKTRNADTHANLVRHCSRRFRDALAWHVTFVKAGEWKIQSSNGISPRSVRQLASVVCPPL